MMIERIFGSVALLCVLGTVPVHAAKPLQPTGKWNVDFGNAHCIAMRDYGTAAAPLLLALKPAPVGDVMQLSLIRSDRSKAINQYAGSLTVGRASRRISVLGYPAKSGKSRINAINLSVADYQPVRTASVIRVRAAGEVDESFALSNMEPVARTLDRCVEGLRKAWNIGGAATQISREASPLKPLTSLFTTDDYPHVALRASADGTVEMMTLIEADGTVASCMVIGSSGVASLDAQTCAIVSTRGKYSPALGLDGKPARSGLINRIKWKLGS